MDHMACVLGVRVFMSGVRPPVGCGAMSIDKHRDNTRGAR